MTTKVPIQMLEGGVVTQDAGAQGAKVIDFGVGEIIDWTLVGNITNITLNNWPASGIHGRLTLYLTQDGTGGRTVAWPAAVRWGTAGAPTLSAASLTDVIVLTTKDGGTTVYGYVVAQGFT